MCGVPLAGGGTQCMAIFLERPNRFVARAQLPDGTVVLAHIADRGRLIETLVPGVTLCLVHRPGAQRATAWQAAAAQRADGSWASLDTLLPNRLMRCLLERQLLPELGVYQQVRREVTMGASRFDFVLEGGPRTVVVEVKSAGRLVGTRALVPDAPSERAVRHVTELAALTRHGLATALVVVAQGEAAHVAIDDTIDPQLSAATRMATEVGVRLIGISSRFDTNGLYFKQIVPLLISI
jgi:sugar fermentation stimulation protein A